ncbi:hypothetical protein [Mycobacterium sp. 1165178.9]|nr:hypothetical protein [Mycobacterium sp. 1165178.9]
MRTKITKRALHAAALAVMLIGVMLGSSSCIMIEGGTVCAALRAGC